MDLMGISLRGRAHPMHALSAPSPTEREWPVEVGEDTLAVAPAPQRYHCLDHLLKGRPGCTFVRCTNMNVRRA
jgi:hypothetical protein